MAKNLTAVIPIGNVKGELFRLKDILRESQELDVKVILVHDNFQDGTSEKLEFLEKQFENVHLIHGQYRSPGKARNAGLKAINSDWFCFWDVDDLPHIPEYVDAIKEVDSDSIYTIIGQFSVKDMKTGKLTPRHTPKINDNVLIQIAANPGIWRFIFATQKYSEFEFGQGSMGEDQIFLAQLNLSEKNIRVVERNFYQYSTNLTGQLTQNKDRVLELIEVIQQESNLRTVMLNTKFIDYLIIRQSITLVSHKPLTFFKIYKPLVFSLININFETIKFVSLVAKALI